MGDLSRLPFSETFFKCGLLFWGVDYYFGCGLLFYGGTAILGGGILFWVVWGVWVSTKVRVGFGKFSNSESFWENGGGGISF